MADKDSRLWDNNRIYIMVLICQTVGFTNSSMMTSTALKGGAIGYLITYTMAYLFIGIPLLYAEMIVSQFTARDCINVWRIRRCLSHIGYILVLWQATVVIQNHVVVSFVTHYMILCFEKPIPFYMCGPWSDSTCNIFSTNYTVNQACLRDHEEEGFCNNIEATYPEYQYWRVNLLKINTKNYHIVYRVCVSSFLLCAVIFICCFKRKRSLQIFVPFMTVYPIFGYVLLLMGSMVQEGSVNQYPATMDFNFDKFMSQSRISLSIIQIVQALGLGSGINNNFSSSTSFRSPCYAYAVITAVSGAAFTILFVCTTAMMLCPHTYQLNLNPELFLQSQMSLIHERIPRVLKAYDSSSFYLIIYFSTNVVLGFRVVVFYFFSLLEIIYTRYEKVACYPGLTCFVGVAILFIITTPVFGSAGIPLLSGAYRRFVSLSSIFICGLECLVFLLWYGLDRISEDVHFMQGIKPNMYFKVIWLSSIGIMAYVFFHEFSNYKKMRYASTADFVGLCLLDAVIFGSTLIVVTRVAVAACRGRWKQLLSVDPSWGPNSEVLQRSRAMFSAQAMTKEYIYRQYQLQAGIMKRQKRANVRSNVNDQRLAPV